MKILVVCNEGNNRSVTIAHHLRYWGHDVLAAGLETNNPVTLEMLILWADRIILTARDQLLPWDGESADIQGLPDAMAKVQLWDVGPDTYPRPFNPELLRKVCRLMQEHEAEYKP